MAGKGDLTPRETLIKAIAVASGGENMSLLTKVLLKDAMKEGSQISNEQLEGVLRKKLGLSTNNQEGGSGSNRR